MDAFGTGYQCRVASAVELVDRVLDLGNDYGGVVGQYGGTMTVHGSQRSENL